MPRSESTTDWASSRVRLMRRCQLLGRIRAAQAAARSMADTGRKEKGDGMERRLGPPRQVSSDTKHFTVCPLSQEHAELARFPCTSSARATLGANLTPSPTKTPPPRNANLDS
jgi:hypothetical protein